MSTLNPQLGDIDDAPFELPSLIRRLGEVGTGAQLDQDRCDMVDAIATHASNIESRLLDGMFSIGHLLVVIGCGQEELDNGHVVSVGALLKHLACEVDYARVTLSNMRHIQQEQLSLKVGNDAGRRRALKRDGLEGRTE